MANKVIKSFRDKMDGGKIYKPKSKDYKGDVYDSKDSKRIAFLVKEGFVEEEKVSKDSSDNKKGKSSKKDGE